MGLVRSFEAVLVGGCGLQWGEGVWPTDTLQGVSATGICLLWPGELYLSTKLLQLFVSISSM